MLYLLQPININYLRLYNIINNLNNNVNNNKILYKQLESLFLILITYNPITNQPIIPLQSLPPQNIHKYGRFNNNITNNNI
eukprot:UN05671